jgi:hypothetical protein
MARPVSRTIFGGSRRARTYTTVAGAIQYGVLVAVLGMGLLGSIRKGLRWYGGFADAVLTLHISLAFWGTVGHQAWLSLALDRGYTSLDRAVDWFPYVPFSWLFGRWIQGNLLGSWNTFRLDLLWAGIALPVWLVTWATWRSLMNHRCARLTVCSAVVGCFVALLWGIQGDYLPVLGAYCLTGLLAGSRLVHLLSRSRPHISINDKRSDALGQPQE